MECAFNEYKTSEDNVQITMTQVDDLCFEATTVSGNKFFVKASVRFGGTGNNPSPLAHSIDALGGCTLIKIKLELVKKGKNCESASVQLENLLIKGFAANTFPKKIYTVNWWISPEVLSDYSDEMLYFAEKGVFHPFFDDPVISSDQVNVRIKSKILYLLSATRVRTPIKYDNFFRL
jgi:hypothetical protein